MKTQFDTSALLEAVSTIAQGAGSAEKLSDAEFFGGLYPVPSQTRSFEPDRILVIGGRGTGKTQIFRALLDPPGRAAVVKATGVKLVHDPARILFIESFTSGRSFVKNAPSHPSADAIESALDAATAKDARKLWIGLSLARLAVDADAVKTLPSALRSRVDALRKNASSPRDSLAWVSADVERAFALIDDVDSAMTAKGQLCVFTFDALDRAANDWATLEIAVGGLLSLALDISRRCRSVRLKVFLRPDLEASGMRSFPDASKLRGYREELAWSTTDLYRMAFKRMGAAHEGGAETREYLEYLCGRSSFIDIAPLGWTPTSAVDEDAQNRVMTALIGKYMGLNPRKGLTYTWIPNHLADALSRVSPRSFLVAFARAAGWMRDKGGSKGSTPLTPTSLAEGVKEASKQRVDELAEDFPWIEEVASQLEALEVPCSQARLLERLKKCRFVKGHASLPGTDPYTVLEKLKDLGVFLESKDGRYNVPDLYRVAMGMKRRGGIKLAE
ncbi:P-loop ATPase, Sll1717 family [Anaeromyxobacter diazotrophicus]|uniref:P-loop ATPase, Sll1717 family n=1 Tax=Anaeromyxobacter diazotrophicus TaxID=2590199 RepID=UPI0015909C89|nr:hypothetical protein [Anaeromyxobacter diazotrophicus]